MERAESWSVTQPFPELHAVRRQKALEEIGQARSRSKPVLPQVKGQRHHHASIPIDDEEILIPEKLANHKIVRGEFVGPSESFLP